MHEVVELIFLFLVFPGLVFTTLLGLFVSWVVRRVSAAVQWRKGPPVTQPFWDVIKLLGKEVIMPAEGWGRGFLTLPFLAFSAAALAALIVWLPALGWASLGLGDLIVALYLLTIPTLAIILGGASSGNPLGAVGASRDMKLLLAYELPFAAALLVAAFQQRTIDGEAVQASTLSIAGLMEFQSQAGSIIGRPSGLLAFLVAILCAQAKVGFVPFDLAEAETEIGEGALIEYSGAALGLFKLTHAVLLVALPVLLVTVFWGGVAASGWGILGFAGKVLLVLVLMILIKNTNPRVRIDQAMRFFWGPSAAVAILALLLAQVGW
jgi:NADH-quinone oxidoreductase subunit H